MLHTYKAIASNIIDQIELGNISRAIDILMHHRWTKGARAAMLCGLVVGALCARNKGDEAVRFLAALDQYAE